MGTLALPQAEDVIICRQSAGCFAIGVSSRMPQIRCRTFGEALQRAGSFAAARGAHLWFTTDDHEYALLPSDRRLRRVWNEFVEMPGLRLTRAQAQRLWSVDESTCTQLLDSLEHARLLVRGVDGRYGRSADEASGQPAPARMAKVNAPARSARLRQVG